MINEIVLYQAEDLTTHIEVKVEDETVWLNRQQIASLFSRDVKTIGKHINNVLKEELKDFSVVANFATTAIDGKVYQIEHYSLDMIISIGYRVKSQQGIQFRIWANKVLKDYLLKGYSLNNRMNRIEDNMFSIMKKVETIDLQINAQLPPNQGVFFEGQVFDAYTLIANIVRTAKKSIVLIDNYIDKKEVYHLGASLKNLGKKWFAFSKMDKDSVTIINSISDLI